MSFIPYNGGSGWASKEASGSVVTGYVNPIENQMAITQLYSHPQSYSCESNSSMFDTTPLTIEEIVDQCRALSLAMIEVSDLKAKEILSFIQAERLELLYYSLREVVIVERN